MPFAGFICEITGDAVAPEECLTCAQAGGGQQGDTRCPFTPALVRTLIADHQPRDLPAYSATELGGCARKVVLRERVPYWIAPGKAYWAFRGRLAHAILEQAAGPLHELDTVWRAFRPTLAGALAQHRHPSRREVGAFLHDLQAALARLLQSPAPAAGVEQRLYAQLDGHLITGQPDLVLPGRGLLVDYKTTKAVPKPRQRYACPDCAHVIRETPRKARKGRALVCPQCGWEGKAGHDLDPEPTPPVPYASHVQQLNVYRWLLAQNGVAITQAEILYLDMGQPLRLPVPLWELAQAEAVIREGLARLTHRGPDRLPYGVRRGTRAIDHADPGNAEAEDADQVWECRYCAVARQCAEAAAMRLNV